MKETTRSLTLYFVIFGALSALLGARVLSQMGDLDGRALPAGAMFAVYVEVIGRLLLGVAFVIAGATLQRALATGAGWIKTMLVIAGGMVVINAVLTMAVLETGGAIVGGAIGLAITVYLHRSVVRLSDEAQNPPPPKIA